MLALGCARHGIDFNAPDGAPARFVFLLVMPPRAHDLEVRILAAIARAVLHADARERLLAAHTREAAFALLDAAAADARAPRRAGRASLADI